MNVKLNKKVILLGALSLLCLSFGTAAFAISGIGSVAANVTGNLANLARLITAISYVGGMAFVVGAFAKFKAYKDNPTQVPIGQPIAFLFIGAALIFAPSVFKTSGATLFAQSGMVAGVSGITTFGATKAGGT